MTVEIGTTPWCWDALGSAGALCRQAQQAESLGFHSFWLPENHFSGKRALPSPLLLLAAVAAGTERIKLGCTSYLLPIRPPLLAAEEVAVLDQLSAGRVILGVGRGMQSAMFKAFGVAIGDKRTLFRKNLDIMRLAWRGEPIAIDENDQPITLSPLPVQQPSPPIWVAAFGPLALKQVATLGLPYLASPLESLDVLTKNYQRYHQIVMEAGLPAVATVPIMRTVLVTRNEAQARDVRGGLEASVSAAMRDKAGEVEDWAIVGDRVYVQERLAQYRECLGLTHLIVRAGISGVSEERQLESLASLPAIVADL